ncbi:MAG: hypothetical protein V1743_04675 [Nanoarchaeota archaeon]
MTRGQISFEFIMMLGMGMIMMILFVAVLNTILKDKNEEVQEELFLDLGKSIQQEVLVANAVEEGYARTFFIPPAEFNMSYERHPYTVNNTNDTVIITNNENTYEFTIPLIEGNFHIGENLIQKINGKIYANT